MILFELISPQGLLLQDRFRMVKLPGTQGDFAVLARHIPLISALRAGEIDLYQETSIHQTLFISGGMVQVLPDLCSVLADTMINVADLDPHTLQTTLDTLSEDLVDAETPQERLKLQQSLDLIQAQLKACHRWIKSAEI